MKIRLILLNFVIFLICNCKTMYGQDSVIVGKASNAKNGAVVVAANDDVYYIDNLPSWGADSVGKSVKITGKIVVKKVKKTKTISGRIDASEIKVIKKPKIEMLSGG